MRGGLGPTQNVSSGLGGIDQSMQDHRSQNAPPNISADTKAYIQGDVQFYQTLKTYT